MNNQYGPDNLERLGAQLAEQRNRERAIVLDLERRAFSRPEEQRSETQRRLASLIEQAREDAATGRLNAELAREPAAGRVYCAVWIDAIAPQARWVGSRDLAQERIDHALSSP